MTFCQVLTYKVIRPEWPFQSLSTVKPVYNDYSWDRKKWSLFRGGRYSEGQKNLNLKNFIESTGIPTGSLLKLFSNFKIKILTLDQHILEN